MPTKEDVQSLIAKLPELDNPPPSSRPATQSTTRQAQRETRRPGAPSKGKLTGPKWDDAARLYDEILSAGPDAVGIAIDLVRENDVGPAYKPRYFLHGLATYVCRPDKAAGRKTVIDALISRLSSQAPYTRLVATQTLQTCGDASAIPALAKLTADESTADPAVRALLAIDAKAAAKPLHDAYAAAPARAKLSILQALGQSKDPSATPLLLQAASDENPDVRLTALWSLASIGALEGIEPILKSTASPESWPRRQAVRAALLLADNLTAAGKSTEAQRILTHLKEHGEKHLAPAL